MMTRLVVAVLVCVERIEGDALLGEEGFCVAVYDRDEEAKCPVAHVALPFRVAPETGEEGQPAEVWFGSRRHEGDDTGRRLIDVNIY
jgi:hypothetical protein